MAKRKPPPRRPRAQAGGTGDGWLWGLLGLIGGAVLFGGRRDAAAPAPDVRQIMLGMIRRFRTDNRIRWFVGQLVQDLDPADHLAKVERIFRFVADRILFLDDPGGEHVAEPVDVLQTMVGDCDCKATLLATLLEAAGLSTQLIFIPGHVFVEVQLDNAYRARLPMDCKFRLEGQGFWVPLESTGNGNPMGWINEQRWNAALAAGAATALRV